MRPEIVFWYNDDLGPVSTLVVGEGTCTWAPQGLGTFFKTATVTFEHLGGVVHHRTAGGGLGELFVANPEPVTRGDGDRHRLRHER